MNYREQIREENEEVLERYQLSMDRIAEIPGENTVREPYASYFKKVARFILQIRDLVNKVEKNQFASMTVEELRDYNNTLYEDILVSNYESSYANPAYAVSEFGNDYGRLLSFVYTEIRAMIADAHEYRLTDIAISLELFIELYNMFEEGIPSYQEAKESVYWFVSDNSDIIYANSIRQVIDPSFSFATEIIMESDLKDLRYLYQYGEFITENEIKTAEFLAKLSEEEIDKMAETYTEGFRRGFILQNKDLSKKSSVNIRFSVGFERLVRESIKRFEAMGLKPNIYRSSVHSSSKKRHLKIGYFSTSPNKQYDYDHRYDNGLYFDKAYYERALSVLKVTYEKNKELAGAYAGPAVMEIFGEAPFEPVDKAECIGLSKIQQKLLIDYTNEVSQITNQYIKEEERSFTIIAFPTPEIGDNFEEIFKETVRINTLDNEAYGEVQQNIIDALDEADYVHILGTNGNRTDLKVKLHQLKDKAKETKFENCLADVNIPLGEVFTSPVLTGTEGILNVSEVYLNDLKYIDLSLSFIDGKITDYLCENFETEEANRKYIKENVLMNHETLPIGEFAIGTNTTAYVMAKKYDIVYKMPILIVEKMGPHFAVGDTCYSRSEDNKVYNPNGKEIIARDNECSILRKEDASKAYFNCHTDITIPYDEIGEITLYKENGEKVVLIKDGRFVLSGTEMLNEAFANEQEDMKNGL